MLFFGLASSQYPYCFCVVWTDLSRKRRRDFFLAQPNRGLAVRDEGGDHRHYSGRMCEQTVSIDIVADWPLANGGGG